MTPFVGEIRMFAGNFAPTGWAFCDGTLQSISQNQVLFQLIGTTYGGDGQSTFALPDLRGRVPIHIGSLAGNSYVPGQAGGVEAVVLTTANMPSHSHSWRAVHAAGSADTEKLPAGYLANGSLRVYDTASPTATLSASTIGPAGAGQSHENMAPFLTIGFIISLFGVFPSQN